MKKIILLFLIIFNMAFSQDFLEPEQAFKIKFNESEKNIFLEVGLGENIYIYDEATKLEIIKPKVVNITKDVKFPTPVNHDEFVVYDNSFEVTIPKSLIEEKAGSKTYELKFSYQGCSSSGICYAPSNVTKTISLDEQNKDVKEEKSVVNETDAITNTLKHSNFFIVLATFFGFGLLLSLTPCVFPMIPILSGIIVKAGKGKKLTPLRGFTLSLIYVFSMSIAYALAGVVAGIFGANLQVALQNPYVLTVFAGVFVFLALSMFGYFTLEIPQSIQHKINRTTQDKEEDGIAGIAIMGFLSALIVGPCVAPPLAGALVYIGQTGDALLGGLALFVMSIGMGIPLLLIGVGAGKFMPRAGGWMENVTKFFGILMLGVAIWLLSRVFNPMVIMVLWGLLLIGFSLYLKRITHIFSQTISKFFAIVSVIMIVGAFLGATNPLNPFEKLLSINTSMMIEASQNIEFKKISSISELENEIKNSKKPVILDFYASWCTVCKELEEQTFSDESVKSRFKDFTILQADVTQNNANDKELMKRFSVFGPPAIIFFDENGKEIENAKIVGFKNPSEFLTHIDSFFK